MQHNYTIFHYVRIFFSNINMFYVTRVGGSVDFMKEEKIT